MVNCTPDFPFVTPHTEVTKGSDYPIPQGDFSPFNAPSGHHL
jgi:hypothetical protein